MKLIGSWKIKYLGFEYNDWIYYIFVFHKDYRIVGLYKELYDGLPITIFGLYFFGFQKIYSY